LSQAIGTLHLFGTKFILRTETINLVTSAHSSVPLSICHRGTTQLLLDRFS